MSEFGGLIEAYERGIREVRDGVAGLGEAALKARAEPGKWSILEIVCHLVDSEQAWCHRLKRTIAEINPLIIGYDETGFTASLDYQARDVEAELDLFDATRRQMAKILRNLPAEAWSRVCIHSERGKMSLKEMVEIETEHITHHLRFVGAKRKAIEQKMNG